MQNTIALVGLSGSGKTTAGPLLAAALGWRYVDTDDLIVARAGRSIADIFASDGEIAFRALETEALNAAIAQPNTVIATGGGIVEAAANRARLRADTFTVWLHAPPAMLHERLIEQTDRPLLRENPILALRQMLDRRAALYADIARWTIATDALTPAQVADEIVRAWRMHQRHTGASGAQVTTPGGSYAVEAGAGLLSQLAVRLERLRMTGRLWLVSDEIVMRLHGDRVCDQLRRAGREIEAFAIPAGEQYKTLDTARLVYDWLLGRGVERGDAVLALGGGVVGDLAGFAAATVLRGIDVVQLPTTVLAMVDSALGGKTGVDHPVGKNLIGAFHQPRLVLADTATLPTLPAAERAAGWAEAIKHGVIGDPQLFSDLGEHAGQILALEEPITGQLIARAAAHKARVVSGDEREHGSRILLNYGHTLGHAIEAESGFALRHGECVAIGMMAAGTIARRLGMFHQTALDQQRATLIAFGLPTRIPANLDADRILARAGSDKKVRSRRIRWVLPTAIGAAITRDDVPEALVREVVRDLAG